MMFELVRLPYLPLFVHLATDWRAFDGIMS